MNGTCHDEVVEDAMNRCLRDVPEYGPVLIGILDQIRRGTVHPQWVNAISQNSQGTKPTLVDAFVIFQLERMFGEGRLAIWTGLVDSSPGPDVDDDTNNATLRSLPRPFSARFSGGDNYSSDGVLSWDEPVEFEWFPTGQAGQNHRILMPPDSVALEVGTTTASRTLLHVFGMRGLARWPYHDRVVTVLRCITERAQIAGRGWAAEDPIFGGGAASQTPGLVLA